MEIFLFFLMKIVRFNLYFIGSALVVFPLVFFIVYKKDGMLRPVGASVMSIGFSILFVIFVITIAFRNADFG